MNLICLPVIILLDSYIKQEYNLYRLRKATILRKGKIIQMANATATTAKTEKAKAGTSPNAQAKSLILILDTINRTTDLTSLDLFDGDEGLAEQWDILVKTFKDTTQRGLPLATRLENVQNEISELYASTTVVNGKAVYVADFEAKIQALLTKKANVERAIKAAKEKASDASGDEVTPPLAP